MSAKIMTCECVEMKTFLINVIILDANNHKFKTSKKLPAIFRSVKISVHEHTEHYGCIH